MSLAWKKPKQSRISRLMSEFQQSPKRGRSLFVETGFPTSLIDLFFKNRDRLKKSSLNSKRDRVKRQIQTAPNAVVSVNPNVVLEKPAVQSKIEKVNFVVSDELAVENKDETKKSVCVCGGGGTAFVLMAFKVLIVMLLTLSTKKKLTVGITLSAFALLLTELAAARLLTRFKLCNGNAKSCAKIETFDDPKSKTEHEAVVTEKQEMFTVRDLLLKDDKCTSKSSSLKSKIVKKLRSYKKKKETVMIKEEESLSEVSSLVSEEGSDSPLVESKGDETNGIVVVMVIVLVGLLSGKILAIGLTLSCLCLKFGLAKRSSGLCK